MLTQEQIIAAYKANLETFFGLTNRAFEGVEKLVELNLQVVKTTLAGSVEHIEKTLAAKDAQKLLLMQTAAVQPLAEKVLAYSRHLYEIALDTQTKFNKATGAQIAEDSCKLQALVDNVSKNAPVGSKSAAALVKSALLAASNAYDSMQKVTRQAAGLAESNFHAATSTASKATARASAQAHVATDKRSAATAT